MKTSYALVLGAIIGSGATAGVGIAQATPHFQAAKTNGYCVSKAPPKAPGAAVARVNVERQPTAAAADGGVQSVTYEEVYLCPAAQLTLNANCRPVVGGQQWATQYPEGHGPAVSTTIERKPRVVDNLPDGGVNVTQQCGWYDETGTRLFNCNGDPVP